MDAVHAGRQQFQSVSVSVIVTCFHFTSVESVDRAKEIWQIDIDRENRRESKPAQST